MSQLNELISDVVATPLGDVIAAVGRGVAEAQAALDEGSLAQTLALYSEGGDAALQLLRDIGYQPTFYTLPETTGTVKVALKLGGSVEQIAQTPAQVNPLAALASSTASSNSATASTSVSATANLRDTIIAARAASLSGKNINAGQLKSAAVNPSISASTPMVATATARQQALSAGRSGRAKLYATPVDASYANRFSFSADVSATLSFKIVPVPPPAGVEGLRLLPQLVGDSLTGALSRLAALDLQAHIRVSDADGNQTDLNETQATDNFHVIAQDPADIMIVRADHAITLLVTSI